MNDAEIALIGGCELIMPYIEGNCSLSLLSLSLLLSLLIYNLQSKDWINTYYMLKSFLKAHRPPKVLNEMKCTNEKMTWNT